MSTMTTTSTAAAAAAATSGSSRYAATVGFDAAAVFLIAIVMPIGVLLMQSRRASKRAMACVLMSVSLMWLFCVERARLVDPEREALGVRGTLARAGGNDGSVVARRLSALVRSGATSGGIRTADDAGEPTARRRHTM